MADIAAILEQGGAQRLAFLRYCVLSFGMEPLFDFLVQEYRLRTSHAAALALFDVFCARQAPARLPAHEFLPPQELSLEAQIERLRAQWVRMQSPPEPVEGEERPIVFAPPARELFDAIVRGVRQDAHGRLSRLASTYNPALTSEENLPGGRMTAGQRQFVDSVWHPVLKPRLVAAGFWRIATVA